MNFQRALKDHRTLRAVTGMSPAHFFELLETFDRVYSEAEAERRKKIGVVRKPGGGRKSFLSGRGSKLFFILFYLKVYPTYDLASVLFGVDRGQCQRWAKKLLPLLEKALGRKSALPARRIATVEEFRKKFPDTRDVFVDGTERPVQRPKNAKNQTRNYSGKKKQHTRKNQIVGNEHRRILVLSPTRNGKKHDKKIFDSESVKIPGETTVWGDSGYQGIHNSHGNVMIPKKKSKKRPLTPSEKDENRLISHFRITVEHAIGGMKRMAACAEKYRNRRGQDDQFALCAAGIWNFSIGQI